MKRIFSKSINCGKTTTASSKRDEFVSVLRNGLSVESYPETIKFSWKVCGMWPVDKTELLQRLLKNRPEYDVKEIEPQKAPEGASYGAIYRSSDDLTDFIP
ncbi:uncharacterized protein MONOS_14969 [Monocercomonoides exilis]|uniref:uncharacterized protein n=1 Tax=Monocercomonoides exilis TaxID=2049356 RepID=UPI00355A1B71|nr:hypothetical protein MONOS_14969 [Monocercomonoides exilis]|eukprot:MONOS_14969.1-p1 / transcript=MONOS_14969.1 / gene=MONOS_14969 / organism=Monocercomonoides_exilis_PA203 / gene_product=unspecified product / transcript_product=unspecified product / location=Mono_scaffold01117:10861-11163(+) / protein_length=101 / sequence_SO=supercontig / SO=protein_coding / is_pseudo=false